LSLFDYWGWITTGIGVIIGVYTSFDIFYKV
jgi:hypothetical protein